MLYKGMYSGRDSSGAAGSEMIPSRFVWPHGGRRVYLCGSFTGWAGQYLMTPVEGCPTIFQTICSVPPGYHQYKFIVDGEWRHDEKQPFVSGSYGTVNTIFLAGGSDRVPALLSPQRHSRSKMDMDNEAFQHLVRVSDIALYEAFPSVSEADLKVSRHHIVMYLSSRMAYELLPESGKDRYSCACGLLICWANKQTSKKFETRGISVAPLWNSCKGQFVGVLSALDFILIIRELVSRSSDLTEAELEMHTVSAWKETKLYLNRQMNGNEAAIQRQLVHAGPEESLKDIALKILQNNVATVPVIHFSSSNASIPQLLHLASLSGILKCICRYFRNSSGSLPILQLPIYAVPLGTWVSRISEPNRRPLSMLRPNASLGSALGLFVQAQVSSIPIVDDKDSLVDLYSRSDITALAKGKAYDRINPEEMTVHQALQLGQEPSSPFGFSHQRCHTCLRSDPLHKVMEQLANPGVRRLIVVEAGSKRVEGIITLSDIFRFLLG